MDYETSSEVICALLGLDIDMTGKGTVCELNERIGLDTPPFRIYLPMEEGMRS